MRRDEGKTAMLAVRIPPELKRAIEVLSVEDQRSVASYVQRILERHVAEMAARKPRK
jgi:predicted DNA-binding protein